MRKFLVMAIGSIALLSAALAADVDQVLSSIQKVQQDAVAAARAENKPVDFDSVQAEQQRIAKTALQGFSVETVNPSDAVKWATVAQVADDYPLAIKLYQVFIGSGASGAELFTAKMNLGRLQAFTGDAAGMMETAQTITPENFMQAGQYVSFVARFAVPTLIEADQVGHARTLLDRAENMLKAQLESDGGSNETEQAARAKMNSTYRIQLVEGRAEILEKEGKNDEAIALLQATAEDESLDASARRSLNAKVAQAKIIGTQAPEIPVEHVLGEFTSLEDLKGKVVLVDFFAHWCGPCVASFPALRDLHKEFADRGFEIVHVTRPYGFFAQTRGISVDDEIEKMRDFKKDHELAWPVVFTNEGPYGAYGVTGIPHLAMVDRNGRVRYVKVGFSQAMIPELKSQIEKLLAESSN